jgi:hypothetical protein
MSKKVYKTTHETITPDGEITRVNKWTSKTEKVHEFVKFMLDEVDNLYGLTAGEYQVLFAAIKEVRYDSLIIANKAFRDKMAFLLNKKPNSISTILSDLESKNIIHRISRGYYELNPQILWKGNEIDRLKRVEYHRIIEFKTRQNNAVPKVSRNSKAE